MALSARTRARYWRWAQYALLAAIVVAVALAADWKQIGASFFNVEAAKVLFPDIITIALRNTIIYTVCAFIAGSLLGLLLALMKMSSVPVWRWIATIYIEFFRGVPALLVFAAVGIGIPLAFEIRFDLIASVTIALGLVSAAYVAETLRAGLQAVPAGQMEAARSLGMPSWRAMTSIIIPQAFRIVLPPLMNEFVVLTKDTSLVYIIGMSASQFELTKMGQDGLQLPNMGLTSLVLAGALYLVITIPLGFVVRRLEANAAKTKR
ncbi:amino acid ABC transporter permease [Falsarthrobacter nasiphocae]|uniref:Polar amino acid transport system permease protein n=1 Tax=Falsarthrobacter nasiphocae TaxID=189863 RepID=A0AAE4C5K9_9MICC|nr:amino acid ABC transporter permease [Falsarthrobacter nasiphocae]MDR6892431.1 polar amino acid transport system permease protein [Falsarthrobacter nasiphocae]